MWYFNVVYPFYCALVIYYLTLNYKALSHDQANSELHWRCL